jgi:hypothetical protein
MKKYLIDFLVAIPLAVGLILTIFCVANAIGAPDDGEKGTFAILSGVVGIPMLYASTVSIIRRFSGDNSTR